MESESNSNEEENNIQDKQEHIKQRLKDLGVSEESTRPEKSWFSRYGNYLMVAVIGTLIVVYWLEYKNQDSKEEQQLTQTEATDVLHNSTPNYFNQQPRSNMQPTPQQKQWMQQQQNMYRQAMQQQEMRRQAWLKQVRDQQEKNRQAWEQYTKQQQEIYQKRIAASRDNSQNVYSQGNRYMQAPPHYPVPQSARQPVYQQPYSNRTYNNGW